ncbi:double-strand break repair protein AddB [Devosia sp. FKR38]|uniref:double-strand break repair protein AddB n=1 Tax=Devosia sp. FKR38 TaxID=2562312 RepID=UPI0010C038E6|nr:double-strand break repair protein AddB [Devosia sp. FKR38]
MTLFSIAPHAPFIATLADRIIDGTLLGGADRSQPFWLTDVTIVLPTRRAKLALADEFARRGLGLLPDIRTFGGEVADEEPFLPPFDAPTPLPAASALERRLVLSRLVHAWANTEGGQRAFSTPPTAGEILSMAESLGHLIDDLLTEERSPADIAAIAPSLEANLSDYWLQTISFLDIALRYWPEHLAGARADTAALRGQRLDRQAMAAPLVYRDRPVIAAGSTGSIPATARLLAAIHALPRGAVVLPGLDCAMTPADHAALLLPDSNPHGHPQYGLARLLRSLGAAISDVTELAPGDHPRTTLVHRALALTEDTARWNRQRLTPEQLAEAGAGVTIIRARTEDEQARAIALAAHAALSDKQTVGIVTPDRNLARRIAAELRRFGVVVDDAAGVPLFQSAAGRLLRQILALASSNIAAVHLMALLRNRAIRFGRDRAEISRLADDIELGLLRGQRPNPGFAGLLAALSANIDKTITHPARRLSEGDRAPITGLLDAIAAAIAPLTSLLETPVITASSLAAALCAAFDAVADGAEIPGRRELADWAQQMASHTGEGHSFAPRQLDGVLSALMLGAQVRTIEERRSDIAIWGQLEARLQNPDLLVLAALNEDKWPEPADPGPWLSRGMRLAAGLDPPERKQGLAAHDFAQGLGNAKVILSYADRVGASPAIASRLLQRLTAFAGTEEAARWIARGAHWLDQARRLDMVPETRPAPRPAPNPPVATRPRALSVTEIETLMRSPYDIYARHVLGLRALDPLGDTPDGRERGTIIHDIFAQFVIDGHDVMAPDAIDVLMAIAVDKFSGLDAIGERRDIWLRRFHTAATQFLAFERAREPMVAQRHAEIRGEMVFPMAEPFTLSGRADRVDALRDGTLEIIDFKTGSPPTKGAMQAFEVPQLLLEAQMAAAGAFPQLSAAPTTALTYIKVGLGPDAFTAKPFIPHDEHDVMSAADEIARRMQRHVELFLMHETPMPARLLPLPGQRFAGAYDHLARLAEWTAIDGGEGEP